MRRLGISLYPEQTTIEQDLAYLKLAKGYGYTRIFTSLLQLIGDDGQDILAKFKTTISQANDLGFQTIVDINPDLFTDLKISYDDLSFFHELGVWGLRLDEGFTGQEEAQMTRNPYGLKIELNMSRGTKYLDSIMAYDPARDNLIGCHNFYPQTYTGLSDDIFAQYSAPYRHYGLHTAAFVSAKSATFGPWPVNEGLPTMESDRERPIASQVMHLMMTGAIDDIIIGNAYASEAELKAAADAFTRPYPTLGVTFNEGVTPLEKKIALSPAHLYRGDASAYMIRDTGSRVEYADEPFPAHDATGTLHRGDVVIVNDGYPRYKGEFQLVLSDFPNDGRRNVIGHVVAADLPQLGFVAPWSRFELVEA